MTDYPSLTITALGNKGSGKTTFLLGMYADLSGGRKGYFLNASDPDVDLALAGKWEKLLDDGVLPPPNPADNIPYSFVFLDGMRPLLAVDWLDYRGGALEDATGAASNDVMGLHERLNRSDSIYLVVDGGYLVEPVRATTKMGIMRSAGLRRMTSLLQNAVQARRSAGELPPSIVVLITKADLIPPDRSEVLDALVSDVQELLSVAFSDGLSTLICPVMLGHFGLNPPATVRTADIDPQDLHLPIIFSLGEYMHELSIVAGGAANASAHQARDLTDQLGALRAGAGRWLRRSAITELDRRRAESAAEVAGLEAVQQVAAQRAAALFDELGTLPLFRNGIEVTR
jgi:hypothetical protein